MQRCPRVKLAGMAQPVVQRGINRGQADDSELQSSLDSDLEKMDMTLTAEKNAKLDPFGCCI
jgi:hypothetical protein